MSPARHMRIVYVNHTGRVSGAERVLINMVRGLDRERFEAFVVCPADSDLTRLLSAEDVTCVALPPVQARFSQSPVALWNAVTSLAGAVKILRTTLQLLHPDLVHANTLRAGIVASLACVGTGRKVVWHLHDILPRHPISTLIRLSAVALRPARIVAVSHATAEAFGDPGAINSRITTIHNGIDLSRFPLKNTGASTELKQRLNIPDDAFVVCAVGQVCARKGLLELVQAFEQAHSKAPKMHLVIAGSVVFEHEREYFNRLQSAASAEQIASHVHFTGEVENVSALLQAADLLVLNSIEEPFGLVLVEAMSSGTPVLAASVGGVPEIVTDSINGWLVEKGDTAALAAKLVELSQHPDLLRRIAITARCETCPQFSLERFQSRLNRLYTELDRPPTSQWNAHNQPAVAVDGDD